MAVKSGNKKEKILTDLKDYITIDTLETVFQQLSYYRARMFKFETNRNSVCNITDESEKKEYEKWTERYNALRTALNILFSSGNKNINIKVSTWDFSIYYVVDANTGKTLYYCPNEEWIEKHIEEKKYNFVEEKYNCNLDKGFAKIINNRKGEEYVI